MFSSATTETATMVVRLFVASREVFVASRRNYEITASSGKTFWSLSKRKKNRSNQYGDFLAFDAVIKVEKVTQKVYCIAV